MWKSMNNYWRDKMKGALIVLSILLLATIDHCCCDKTERKCMNGYVYELPENGTHWMVNGDKCGEEIE